MSETPDTWQQVMNLKKAGEGEARGVANTLDSNDIITILSTIDFFGGNVSQDKFDLSIAKYRVFDWLAMRVMGRGDSETATKVLVHSFLKSGGVPSKYVNDLRFTDYQIDTSWEKVKL
jgi:hypothetical protein